MTQLQQQKSLDDHRRYVDAIRREEQWALKRYEREVGLVFGSQPWDTMKHYVRNCCLQYRLPWPKQLLPDSYLHIVGRHKCSEMWLKYYSLMRSIHGCVVMASDFANKMTKVKRPIVRNLELDQKLLCAHAEILRMTKENRRKLTLPEAEKQALEILL